MAGSASYAAPPTTDDPHPVISCTLNKGTAGRLEAVTAINLSPNRIAEVPTPCVPAPYPLPEINPEEGKEQKPNFMYMPMYQYSCSSHPRSAGLAHEDNYDCLKKSMNAGNAEGFCCAAAAGCMANIKFFKKDKDAKGNPVWITQSSSDDPFFEIFNCLGSTGGNPGKLPPYYEKGRRESFQREECNFQNSCRAGFNKGWSGAPNGGCQAYGGKCKCEDSGTTRWAPLAFGVSRLYNISGNTECDSCKAPGGIVYVDGYTDCWYCMQECWILDELTKLPIKKCTNPDGTVVQPRLSHTCDAPTGGGGGSQFCACNFTDIIEVGGSHGTWYISTFIYPTNMFSNWAPIGLMGNGSLGSTSCNGEFVYNCDEVS